mmetsp:Transcript_32083/g.53681  ORF Transcript_32083/g.53681 Transcript_32083/m.53681 type:complete len:121 (+) Transcript_32083:161-523(+)
MYTPRFLFFIMLPQPFELSVRRNNHLFSAVLNDRKLTVLYLLDAGIITASYLTLQSKKLQGWQGCFKSAGISGNDAILQHNHLLNFVTVHTERSKPKRHPKWQKVANSFHCNLFSFGSLK